MKSKDERELLAINRRFCEICIALEITDEDEGTPQFYKNLRSSRLAALINSDWALRDGWLHVTQKRMAGPAQCLANELTGKAGKRGLMQEQIAEQAVRRLFGFVKSEQGWTLVPRALQKSDRSDGASRHRRCYDVIPARIRATILEIWEATPYLLEEYVERAISYLSSERADPLPDPPWAQPIEFVNGHQFILEFFDLIKEAVAGSRITVAAVNSYITASIGHQHFLNALKRKIPVRFLIYDFIHGDAKHVAKMIRRSEQAFYVFASDTVDALLALRAKAEAIGKAEKLEVRLIDKDPEGRWYIIDESARPGAPARPKAFFVRRASGEPSKSANARGDRASRSEIPRHLATVEQLWEGARPLDDWLPDYKVWKERPTTQRILGQR